MVGLVEPEAVQRCDVKTPPFQQHQARQLGVETLQENRGQPGCDEHPAHQHQQGVGQDRVAAFGNGLHRQHRAQQLAEPTAVGAARQQTDADARGHHQRQQQQRLDQSTPCVVRAVAVIVRAESMLRHAQHVVAGGKEGDHGAACQNHQRRHHHPNQLAACETRQEGHQHDAERAQQDQPVVRGYCRLGSLPGLRIGLHMHVVQDGGRGEEEKALQEGMCHQVEDGHRVCAQATGQEHQPELGGG